MVRQTIPIQVINDLARTSIVAFGLRIVSAGMSYVFVVLLARVMETADFGVVATIMSASLLFSVVGCAGQRMALLRFVPPLIDRADAPPPVSTIACAFRLAMIGNTAVFVLLVAAAFLVQAFGRIDDAALIAFGLLIVPLTGMIDMQAHLSRAYGSIVLALLPKDVLWRLISGLVLVGAYFASGESKVGPFSALVVLVVVLGLLILIQGSAMHRLLGVPGFVRNALHGKVSGRDAAWERARLPLWVASITAVAFTNLDVVAAGVVIGREAAALYFAANRIAQVPNLVLASYNIVIGPKFSGHHAAGRTAELHRVARDASLQIFLPTVVMVAILGMGAQTVLWLFGPQFTAAGSVLRILLAAALINAAFGPSDLILTMCGQERAAMMVGLWGTVVGSGLIIGSALFGGSASSLAWGTLAAIAFTRVLSWSAAYQSLGFSADAITSFLESLKQGRASRGSTD